MVIATPYLDEAERCARVALLDRGRLLALDEPARLQRGVRGMVVEIVAAPPRRALELARAAVDPVHVQLFGDRLHVRVERAEAGEELARRLRAAGVEVSTVRSILPTLEDVFIERLAAEREVAS
jgi:ABC-2 type transport system ATP-binding protein